MFDSKENYKFDMGANFSSSNFSFQYHPELNIKNKGNDNQLITN